MIGRKLGDYLVEEKIGAGGMGVVYRARDTKLERSVAIKVLPESCARDAERRGRFEREAKVLAAIDHPNIAGIHGIGEAEGVCYLALELVPGENLAERLAAGPLLVKEALDVCRQIAAGVEAAHEKGIIHRDLKPSNVKVTPGGQVKVLDFGLARAFQSEPVEGDPSHSPTVTAASTVAGVILGTAAYMSPEQARGKPLDKRTDIWSFGCVLFEALARRKAFQGETVSDYMAAILEKQPDWDALPKNTPGPVRRLIERCLQKDRNERLRDIGDARMELDEAVATLSGRLPVIPEYAAPAPPKSRTPAIAAGVAAGAIAATLIAAAVWRQAPPPAVVARFGIPLAAGEVVPPSHSPMVAITSDGRYIAYSVTQMATEPEAPSPAMRPATRPMAAKPAAKSAMGMGGMGGSGMGSESAMKPPDSGMGGMGGGMSPPAGSQMKPPDSGMGGMGGGMSPPAGSQMKPDTGMGGMGGSGMKQQAMGGMEPASGGQPMAQASMGGATMRPMMSQKLYLRPLDQVESRVVESGDVPFFSPDGKWLGFFNGMTRTLRKVAVSGGSPTNICPIDAGIAGATWGPDDQIVFAWRDLFRVSAQGGTPEKVLEVDEKAGERFYRHPQFLPDGKTVLFTVSMADTESHDEARIGVYSLASKKKKILVSGGMSPHYSPSGHVVYARGGKLMAVPFDAGKLEVTGQAVPVVDGVFMSVNTGKADFAISANGTLVYAGGGVEGGERVPVWVSRNGGAEPLGLPPRSYLHPRLSPDEKQLAIEVEGPSHDFYDYDFARGTFTKLSFDGASHWPLWTPDGKRIAFRSWRTGGMTLWWMPADRSGQPEMLTDVGTMQSPESWSPDGRALAFTQMDKPENMSDILVLTLDDRKKPRALVQTKFAEGSPKFSPDGKWLAYCSNESGRPEVYVAAYPGPGAKIQVSTDGGTDPAWRHKGGEIYYRNGDRMMVVTASSGGMGLGLSRPRELWRGHYLHGLGSSCGMPGPTSSNYDVTADGERFIMIKDSRQDVVGKTMNVVLGWSEELKRAGARAGM